MKITIDVDRITVLRLSHGTDMIALHTSLPTPFPVEVGGGQLLTLGFEVTRGRGEEYVERVFGIEPELINCGKGKQM